MKSSLVRRLLRRWRSPTILDLDTKSLHSVFQKTFVHRTIEKWHLSDKAGKVPLLFPKTNVKWSSYPADRIFAWSEVQLNAVRCPGNFPKMMFQS